jgi:hypothetical protein
MTAISLRKFGGMVPKLGDQILPDFSSTNAENTYLFSGELQPFRQPGELEDFGTWGGNTLVRAYRLPTSSSDEWVGFESNEARLVKGPLVNDSYNRYYWTEPSASPMYNTLARIQASSDPYLLGVPQPTNTPTMNVTSGTENTVTRAYVFTYVTTHGEEGPPSEPVIDTGYDDGTWTLANMNTTSPDADIPITHKNIYRTITGVSGTADYHFVAQITLATASYADTETTDDVSLNDVCESWSYYPPPSGLQGLIAHPNGFLMGYDGRDLYFSEPYLPHAWPPEYVVSTSSDIMGMGVFGQTAVVPTQDFPYVATGVNPAAITFTKINTPEPCECSCGVVSFPSGVYYPSSNGLVLVNARGIQVVTEPLMTREQWQAYSPSSIKAARYFNSYMGFYGSNAGFIIDLNSEIANFVELGTDWDVDNISSDQYSGDVFVTRDNVIYQWNPLTTLPNSYIWESKEFDTPKPTNFGAARIEWRTPPYNYYSDADIAEITTYNAERNAAGPLNPIGWAPIGESKDVTLATSTYPQTKQTFCQGPLYDLSSLTQDQSWLRFTLYGDDEIRIQKDITHTNMFRLPSGYKCTRWKIKIEGDVIVTNVKIAEVGKELNSV